MHFLRNFALLFFILNATALIGQDRYANLTALLKNFPEEKIEREIYSIYNRQNPKSTQERLELKLWKFCMLDSFNLEVPAHNLAQELQTSVPKMEGSLRYTIYQHLGEDCFEKADYKNAIAYNLKTTRLESVSEQGKAAANRTIGLSYVKLSQFNTAIRYLKKSVDGFTLINNRKGLSSALMTLGNAYKSQKKFDLALQTYEKSLEIAIETKNARYMAGNYNNMGSAYRHKGEIQKAIDYYLKALDINIESGNKQWESFNYNNLANCYADIKNDRTALVYFEKSQVIKIEMGDSIALMETYNGMSQAYSRLKEYKKGFDYLYEYTQMKERFDLADQTRMLAESEGKYNTAKKQDEIEKLQALQELESLKNDQLELKAERNRIFFILLGCIGLLMIGGLIYLYRSNKTRQRLNEALSSANKDISMKNSEIIDSINYATQIQKASLPNLSEAATNFISYELFFAPKDIVSGDFYFSYKSGSKTYFGLGDCTGHGVPGAMVSLIGLNAFEKVVSDNPDLGASEIIEKVNLSVIQSLYRGEEINDGMDVSFCIIDEQKKTAHYVGANHTSYLLRRNSGSSTDLGFLERASNDNFTLFQMNGARRPIGKSYSKEKFFQVDFDLKAGDKIILGTDGYADQFGGKKGKKLKKSGLVSSLINSSSLPLHEQMEKLKNIFLSWKGLNEQVDDVCILIAEVK